MIWSLVVLTCGVGFIGLVIARLLPKNKPVEPAPEPAPDRPKTKVRKPKAHVSLDAITQSVPPAEPRTVVVPIPVICGKQEREIPGHSTTWVFLDGKLPNRG